MGHISNEASVLLGRTLALRVLSFKSISHLRHQIFVALYDVFHRARGFWAPIISWLHPRNPQGILAMMTIVAFLLKRRPNVKRTSELAYRRKFWKNMMINALTYEEWAHAAKMLNKETPKMNESDLYDVELVRNKVDELRHCRKEGSLRDIIFCMRADLVRNLGNMCNSELHKGRLHVPRLIKEYIDEVSTQLRIICYSDSEELALEEKLAFMHETRHAFGRTALLLSGGASLGAFHVGVVKTLVEHKLMPRIIAGSSVGSIMCSIVATRSWPELHNFFEVSLHSLQFFDQMGGVFSVVKRITTLGAVHEIRQLQMMLRHLTSNLTFQEAYDMTGRVLAITVCSPRKHEPPRCLNYLTSPNVVIWSAVTASCAFPGLFEDQELMAKDRNGEIVPYHPPFNLGPKKGSTPVRCWRDGSLEIDLPMMQLKELFNVNHFIVSQANPHIAPLLTLTEFDRAHGANFAAKLAHLVEMKVKHRCHQVLELGFPLGGLAKLFAQDWEGDVTVVMPATLAQYSKIIQNPSYWELQKAANQGRRCTWEKLSAIKANCGIEIALDECVAILNHMRRRKRSAERAAAASHGHHNTVKLSASKRIPSWNVIAQESSTGSLEEDFLMDAASSMHQGVSSSSGATGTSWKTHHIMHDISDSESKSADLNSWTRSGGPLMRTTSANTFIDFVQNLEVDTELNRGMTANTSHQDFQYYSPRHTTPDRCSENSESDQRKNGNRVVMNASSIMVTEGHLLQPEIIHNGIVFNVVKKEDLTPPNRSHYYDSYNNEVAECVQIDCPGKGMALVSKLDSEKREVSSEETDQKLRSSKKKKEGTNSSLMVPLCLFTMEMWWETRNHQTSRMESLLVIYILYGVRRYDMTTGDEESVDEERENKDDVVHGDTEKKPALVTEEKSRG